MRDRDDRNATTIYLLLAGGTVLEGAVFLFEIPTGVVADVYSRRLSIIIGLFLIGAGFMLQGALPLFATILLSEALWGIGYTFTSGAQQAWITDEIGEAAAGPVFLRAAQAGRVGGLLGFGAGVGLGALRINLPILVGGALFLVLGLLLILAMPERGFRPTARQDRTTWGALGHTLGAGLRLVRGRPVLLTIVGITACAGAASEGFDRLWQAHVIRDVDFPLLPAVGQPPPIVWFGLLDVAAMLLTLGATELVRRRVDTTSHLAVARTLFLTSALLIAGMITVGLATTFAVAAGAYLLARAVRGTNDPLATAWINQSLEPGVRATVFSLISQADALGQIGGGPVVGALATARSIRTALVASGVALTPVLGLYAHTTRRPAEPAPRIEVAD